jgi:hypothetical protein
VKRAVIQRALRAQECRESGAIGISSVLIGTPGQHGLSIAEGVAAVVEGAVEALVELSEMKIEDVRFEELELIDLYEVRATEALEQLREIHSSLPVELRDAVALNIAGQLTPGRGRRPGMPTYNSSGAGWPRFLVERHLPPCPPAEPPDTGTDTEPGDSKPAADNGYPCGDWTEQRVPTRPRFEFTRLGRGAQVDRLSVEFDDDKIRAMIAAAARNPFAVDETIALFEMLFPHAEKLEISDTDNLHLLVDEDTAAIPWELLCGRGEGNPAQALAMRAGLLRQLRPGIAGDAVRRNGRTPVGNRALVVGDPPAGSGVPRLHGARQEARAVVKRLEQHGYTVERLIFDDDSDPDDSWVKVQTALYRHPYRIIHFATHGHVDERHPERTGLLIGPEQRLTALDIQQMSVTPEFVFLNACHVGRAGSSAGASRTVGRANELAANLGMQLMRNGVQAVVAAGWAVDDQAAITFADTLYAELFSGQHYGIAVHEARKRTYDNGRTNTWGAYQCYGDPSFSVGGSGRPWQQPVPVSPGQLVQQLDVLTAKAGDDSTLKHLRSTHASVRELDDRDVGRFPQVEVYEALARAYGELGCHHDATWAYREALRVDKPYGRISLTAIEQLANMEAYVAVLKSRSQDALLAPHHEIDDSARSLFGSARNRLTDLIKFGETQERHCLLGGLFKKQATTRKADDNRAADVARSRDAYRRAFVLTLADANRFDPYSGLLWVQMSRIAEPSADLERQRDVLALLARQHLADADHGDQDLDLIPALLADLTAKEGDGPDPAVLRGLLDAVPPDWKIPPRDPAAPVRDVHPDFWSDATPADLLLTRAVLDVETEQLPEALNEVEQQFAVRFRNRSTVRKRLSVVQHIRDLGKLIGGERGAAFNDLADRLDRL